jgi:hypothetical protein
MTRFIVLPAAVLFAAALSAQAASKPAIPKVWDDIALADWATPVATLNVRPKHISAAEYYSLPVVANQSSIVNGSRQKTDVL